MINEKKLATEQIAQESHEKLIGRQNESEASNDVWLNWEPENGDSKMSQSDAFSEISERMQKLEDEVRLLQNTQQRMEMGSFQFDPGYKEGKWELGLKSGYGYRNHDTRVQFQFPFSTTPNVFLSIKRLDHNRHHAVRFNIEAINVRQDGFTLRITTWDTSEIYGAGVFWLAIENIPANWVHIGE